MEQAFRGTFHNFETMGIVCEQGKMVEETIALTNILCQWKFAVEGLTRAAGPMQGI